MNLTYSGDNVSKEAGQIYAYMAVKGGAWVFGINIFARVMEIIKTVIIARLLEPRDFGLFGISLLVLYLFEMVSQAGFEKALIQKKEDISSYLDTAWIIQVFRGVFLGALIAAISPVIAVFFDAPPVKNLLVVIGASVALNGFANIGIIYFQKDLLFDRLFVLRVGTQFTNFFVSITLAVIYRSVWALVLGYLAGVVMQTFLSYVLHSYRPRFRFALEKAKEMFSYGKWIFSSSALIYFVDSLDDIVVGKLLKAYTLGLYQMAYNISNFAATKVCKVMSQVAFPVYSKLQNDLGRLREGFSRTMSVVAIISLPITFGLFVLAPDLVRILLGDKWLPIVLPLRAMCFIGALRSVTGNFGPVFLSLGRPDILTKLQLINLAILGVSIIPMVNAFGIMGAVYSRLLTFATQLYTWPRLIKIMKFDAKGLITPLVPSVVSTFVMSLALFSAKLYFTVTGFWSLLLFVSAGALIYCLTLFVMDRTFKLGIKQEFIFIYGAVRQ